MNDGTHALILSGGGAYGAYEVGVMKALLTGQSPATDYRPLDVGVFTGTSVGAYNAAVMSMQPGEESASTVSYLENLWINRITDNAQTCGNAVFRFRGNAFRYLEPECFTRNPAAPFIDLTGDAIFFAQDLITRGSRFFQTSGSLPQRLLQAVDISAFISIEPFKQLVRETAYLEGIRRSEKKLRIAATNWETGEVKIFENKDMTDEYGHRVVMASAAIPGIFPPVDISGQTYVDGGVVMNTPLKCAIDAGATILHVIYLDPDVQNVPLRKLQNTVDTIDRLFTIALATKTNEDIDTAAWVNEGLDAIERASRGESISDTDMRNFIRVAGQIEGALKSGTPYRKLTIHRYHPHYDLGGLLGMLDFNQQVISDYIDRGFADAASHDCAASHCILP